MATLKFLGAAQEVTGSCYLLESVALGRVLLDCGMHQGGSAVDRITSEHFDFDPTQIDAVILSHAHLDHSGLLPKLVHAGFRGAIHCTEATAELLDIMLNDAAGLYQRDLERKNLQQARKGLKALKPDYVKNDVLRTLKLCHPHPYKTPINITEQTTLCFHDAGHILGSSIVEITLEEKQQRKTLVFSGDLGKQNAVLMNDPDRLEQANVLLMESTYGNRNHRPMEDTIDEFRDLLRTTWDRGGNIIIPAFAVGRTQELLFHLGRFHREGELDNWQVILDSPMAIAVTKIYDRWLHTLDCQGIKKLSSGDQSLLSNFIPRLHLSITPQDSMAINNIKKGAIIIVERSIYDADTNDLYCTLEQTLMLRADGGFDGEAPPAPSVAIPDRTPDKTLSYATTPGQAIIYRLSGDWNPLHIDPEIAKSAGFPQPILHGYCSYGIAGWAACLATSKNTAQLKQLECQFTGPVIPGDELTFQFWSTEDNEWVFNAKVKDRVVLNKGRVQFEN